MQLLQAELHATAGIACQMLETVFASKNPMSV